MPHREARIEETISRQPTFIAGCNDFLLADQIGETASVSMLNLDASDRGTLVRRPPVSTKRTYLTGLSGIEQQPRMMKSFQDRHHGPVLVVVTDSSDGTSQVFIDDGTVHPPLQMQSPHKLDSDCDIVTLFDKVFILQPGQPAIWWAWGNTTLHVDDEGKWNERFPPSGTAAYFLGKAWAGDKDLVFFSNTFATREIDPTQITWDTQAQAHSVRTGRTVKLLPYRTERLLVFTTRGIESFQPNVAVPFLTLRSIISDSIGCSSKQTPHILGEDVLWVDHTGHVRSLIKTEADEPIGVLNEPLSLSIQGTITRQTKTRLFASRATVWQGDYFVAFPMDGSPFATEIWRYSPRNRAWYGPWLLNFDPDGSGIGSRSSYFIHGMVALSFPGDIERLYVLTRSAAGAVRLIQFDPDRTSSNRQDGNVPIRSRLTSRGFAFRNPEKTKFPVNLRIEGRFARIPLTASMPSGATLEAFSGACSGYTLGISIRADGQRWIAPSVPTLAYFVPDAAPILGTSDATLPFRLKPPGRLHVNLPLPNTVLGRELELEIEAKDSVVEFEILSIGLLAGEGPVELDR